MFAWKWPLSPYFLTAWVEDNQQAQLFCRLGEERSVASIVTEKAEITESLY